MNQYITGSIIKKMRESKGLTQQDFAQRLGVSDKAVSKWETGKGYPDITLIEPISKELGISVTELIAGDSIVNSNKSGNMMRVKFYVCPICGNIITSMGESVISCCGINLMPLEAEEYDGEHMLNIENVEDELYITLDHSMTKNHYISFIATVCSDSVNITKLYPEGDASVRIKRGKTRAIYYYCNKHGFFVNKFYKKA